jgi:hypothetical protein
MPPKPKMAATSATQRNTNAQCSMVVSREGLRFATFDAGFGRAVPAQLEATGDR